MSESELRLSEAAPEGLAPLIESIPFGSEGLRYRRLKTGEQIDRFHAPMFISAYQKQRLIGAYVIDRRRLIHDERPITGFYRGLLVVDERFQGQSVGQQLTRAGFEWIQRQAAGDSDAVLTYGCIDASNERSLRLLQSQGAVRLGGLSRFMMYSQWPRATHSGCLVQTVDEPQALALINQTTSECRLRDVTPASSPSQGLFINGELLACARVSRSRWCIEDMGSLLSLTDRLLVRPFPMARKRFDSKCFECLQLSDVGLSDASEPYWNRFVSALLAQHKLHFAMLLIDPASALHQRLRRIGWLGPLIHGTKPDIHVMGRWVGNTAIEHAEREGRAAPLALVPVDL